MPCGGDQNLRFACQPNRAVKHSKCDEFRTGLLRVLENSDIERSKIDGARLLMFPNERVRRAARAIDHELFYQKNGFMAHADSFANPTSTSLDLAAAATLAADCELETLQALRSTRQMWLDLALEIPRGTDQMKARVR